MARVPILFRLRASTIIIFWVVVIGILLGFYFFAPSIFYRVMQTPYQETPFVNTPTN